MFGASNVELITKTRSEHLTEHDKARSKNLRTPLQNFLGIAEVGASQSSSEIPKVSIFICITLGKFVKAQLNLDSFLTKTAESGLGSGIRFRYYLKRYNVYIGINTDCSWMSCF